MTRNPLGGGRCQAVEDGYELRIDSRRDRALCACAMALSGLWRSAIVTGAASGIGRCFAEALVSQGTALALFDISAEGLAATAQTVRSRGGRAEECVVDTTNATDVAAAVERAATALGGLSLVIHCAGILGPGHFSEQSATDFERVIRVNLLGTANMLRAAAPALRQSRGSMACLASTAAVHGWPALSAYSASKFGVAGFCDGVRGELARDGVCITAVFPLLIDTPLLAGASVAPILRGRKLPASAVVQKTLAGVARRKARVFIPETVRVVTALHGIAPSLLDWYGRRFGF